MNYNQLFPMDKILFIVKSGGNIILTAFFLSLLPLDCILHGEGGVNISVVCLVLALRIVFHAIINESDLNFRKLIKKIMSSIHV